MSNDSNSNNNKKRKANDGQAVTDCASNNDGSSFLSSWLGFFSGRRDETSPGPPQDESNTSQLDRMENIMMRVEDKLATVSSLESRCEKLEEKCSKLEDMLEAKCSSLELETKLATTSQSMKDHMDRSLRYNEMLILNQKWKYSARVYTRNELIRANYETDEADYIYETCQYLKNDTEAMRRGDFPNQNNMQNKREVSLFTNDDDLSFDDNINSELSPHWREFAAALKQFKPAFDILPDDCMTSILFGCVQLNREMTELIQEALVNIPFKMLSLSYTYRIHGGMSTIARIMKNNKYLQMVDIYQMKDMDDYDVAELCYAIHLQPSVKDVSIIDCFSGDGLGDEMLRTLLSTGGSKLETLTMSSNNISSVESTLLPDFLATNPRLILLDLSGNEFNDNDAVFIANALRSNTTLKRLVIEVGDDGNETLRVAVCDESSLNSVADSNHSCSIETEYGVDGNETDSREINRSRKIYSLLASRHETMSNVQHFGDIDVKLLPKILAAVQKYSNMNVAWDTSYCVDVKALSIVYEVMRRWDKVSPLYKSLGMSIE